MQKEGKKVSITVFYRETITFDQKSVTSRKSSADSDALSQEKRANLYEDQTQEVKVSQTGAIKDKRS